MIKRNKTINKIKSRTIKHKRNKGEWGTNRQGGISKTRGSPIQNKGGTKVAMARGISRNKLGAY